VATQADWEKVNAHIAEPAALCEAAQQKFERINTELQKSIRVGREPDPSILA
jgi:hypothetical protein